MKGIAPYLKVLAAVLVFGSWIVTNALVDRMKSNNNRMSAIFDAQDNYRRFSRLMPK